MASPLIARLRSGDLTAFAALYDLSYEKIYRFVYHRVMDTMDAQDIVSDIYMKALRKVSTFRGTEEWEFFSWLYRIAYTSIIDGSRHKEDKASLDELEYDPWTPSMSEKQVANEMTLEKVLAYLNTMPARDKSLLIMRIWDDLSYSEISQITGVSIDNAKKIVSRTLTKISANVTYLFIFSLFLSYVSKY